MLVGGVSLVSCRGKEKVGSGCWGFYSSTEVQLLIFVSYVPQGVRAGSLACGTYKT